MKFEIAAQQPVLLDNRNTSWRDWLGIVASIGCAIHCAAMPFVVTYLPALGLGLLAGESFHKWMALVCFLVAIAAFLPGVKRHGNWLPISIGILGLAFITFAAFGMAGKCCPSCEPPSSAESSVLGGDDAECENCDLCSQRESDAVSKETDMVIAAEEMNGEESFFSPLIPLITPFGGLLLVSAHLLNRRFGCACGYCSTGEAPLSETHYKTG